MVITREAMKKDYKSVEPVNGNVLAIFTDKETDIKKGSLYIPNDTEETQSLCRSYLVIEKISKEAQEQFPTLSKGDIVEVMSARDVNYFFGANDEKYVLFDCKSIAGIYSHKEKKE